MPLWGTSKWGDTRWSEAVTGHLLTTSGAISITATGVYLRHSHILTVQGIVDIRALNLGVGPAPIHPVSATGLIDISVAPSFLALQHQLDVTGIIDIVLPDAPLRLYHSLAVTGLVGIVTPDVFLSIRHVLATMGLIDLQAFATDLDLSHPLTATGLISLVTHAAYETILPTPVPVEFTGIDPHSIIHGTVNLIGNPTLEQNAVGWNPEVIATVTRDTTRAWHGPASAKVVKDNGAGRGLAVRSYQALGIVPYPGSVLWGQIRLSGASVGIEHFVRARYTDGSTVETPHEAKTILASGVGSDWQFEVSPPLVLDPLKVLDWAEIVVVGGGAATFYADGAMLEYDPYMYGPSLWIIGSTEAAVFAEA